MEILEKENLIQGYKKDMNQIFHNKEFEKILSFLQEHMDVIKFDNDLMIL